MTDFVIHYMVVTVYVMKLLCHYCAVLVNSFGTTHLVNRHHGHRLMLHQTLCLYDVQELVVVSYTQA